MRVRQGDARHLGCASWRTLLPPAGADIASAVTFRPPAVALQWMVALCDGNDGGPRPLPGTVVFRGGADYSGVAATAYRQCQGSYTIPCALPRG